MRKLRIPLLAQLALRVRRGRTAFPAKSSSSTAMRVARRLFHLLPVGHRWQLSMGGAVRIRRRHGWWTLTPSTAFWVHGGWVVSRPARPILPPLPAFHLRGPIPTTTGACWSSHRICRCSRLRRRIVRARTLRGQSRTLWVRRAMCLRTRIMATSGRTSCPWVSRRRGTSSAAAPRFWSR